MSCQWRDKVASYVDDELEPAALEEFSAHLGTCAECPAAISELLELKIALRMAGSKFTAPPELRAAIYGSIHPSKTVSRWWKWAMAPVCALLLGAVGLLLYPRARAVDPMIAGVIDSHITALASPNPVDVISDDTHKVRPWYAGKLPFTFQLPAKDTQFSLIGGKLVYAEQRPGAQLLYQAGPHKISIFIFKASNQGTTAPVWNHDVTFTAASWRAGGRDCYLVSDASRDEAGKLVAMFQEANRQ